MDDDFNSREAITKVLGSIREIQRLLDGKDLIGDDRAAFAQWSVDWIEEFAGKVLGLLPSRELALEEPQEDPRRTTIAVEVEELIQQRQLARFSKDWEAADKIRDKLADMGVTVEDTPDGPVWKLE